MGIVAVNFGQPPELTPFVANLFLRLGVGSSVAMPPLCSAADGISTPPPIAIATSKSAHYSPEKTLFKTPLFPLTLNKN